MKTYAGLWIDYEKAYLCFTAEKTIRENIVFKDEADDSFTMIESGANGHVRLAGGSRTRGTPYGPQDVADDKKLDARRKKQLRDYYRRIIAALGNVDHIYIFGPAEAKFELNKEIQRSMPAKRPVVTVEAADKMTRNQIIAKVRHFFSGQTLHLLG